MFDQNTNLLCQQSKTMRKKRFLAFFSSRIFPKNSPTEIPPFSRALLIRSLEPGISKPLITEKQKDRPSSLQPVK